MTHPEQPQKPTDTLAIITQEDIDAGRSEIYDIAADLGVLNGRGKFFQIIEPGVRWDFLLATPLEIGRPEPMSCHRFTFNRQTYDAQHRVYGLSIDDYILMPRTIAPVSWMAASAGVTWSDSEAKHKYPTIHSAPLVHPHTQAGTYEITSGVDYEQRFLGLAMSVPERPAESLIEASLSICALTQALKRFSGVSGQDVLQLYERALHNPAA